MTKQELETRVQDLELTLNAVELNAKTLKDDLTIAQRSLANVNKPMITKETVNELRETIQHVLDNYDFNNGSDYDYDFEIGYNNQIELSNIEFQNVDEIAESLSYEVEALFNIEEDAE
ncbi:hypothetical protein N9P20_00975 [Polaribacter sp.]|nr:hypothetical protein [Polaribacter sp.]